MYTIKVSLDKATGRWTGSLFEGVLEYYGKEVVLFRTQSNRQQFFNVNAFLEYCVAWFRHNQISLDLVKCDLEVDELMIFVQRNFGEIVLTQGRELKCKSGRN